MSVTPWKTSDGIIEAVKRKIMLPLSQVTFSEEDILSFANEEMATSQVPSILQFHEEYLLTSKEVTIEASKSRYPIPDRAIGLKLRDLFYKDTSGNLWEMTRISSGDQDIYSNSANSTTESTKYRIEGNDVILLPDVNTSPVGSLVFSYYIRPNQLVKDDRAAIVSSIATASAGNIIITFSSIPEHIVSGSIIDFLQTKPGHKILSFDITAGTVDSTAKTITFSEDDVPEDLIVNDYVCVANESIIPQIPTDLHNVLVERTAGRILAALGDAAGLQASNSKVQELEVNQAKLIDNRSEGSPQKILGRHSFLKLNSRRRRGY